MNKDLFVLELKKIAINISDKQLKQLQCYYNLLTEYNQKINLTSITNENDVFLKHFYDSLTINKVIDLKKVKTFCDIGTGAGFPGLIIKILFPEVEVTLVDSLNKRISFLNDVIKELDLKKIKAICERAENFSINHIEEFDVVCARAVAKTPMLLEISAKCIKINGVFIAMKANINISDEISKECLNKLKFKIVDTIKFLLPIEKSNRTLIKFVKFDKTPNVYPRKFEQIKKKPL